MRGIILIKMDIDPLSMDKIPTLCRLLTAFPIFEVVDDSTSRKPKVLVFRIKKEKWRTTMEIMTGSKNNMERHKRQLQHKGTLGDPSEQPIRRRTMERS